MENIFNSGSNHDPLPAPAAVLSADVNAITPGYGFNRPVTLADGTIAMGQQSPTGIVSDINSTTNVANGLISGAVNQGQQNLQNAAKLTGGAAGQILQNAYGQQGYQQGQGQAGMQQANELSDYNNQLGQAAMQNFGGLGQQANEASAYYGQGGAEQMQNSAQARGMQLQNIADLQKFYTQGPGPSAAEAQLNMASDRAQANAMSLANSGRGAGDNAVAMRQAMFANAATQGQTNQQMALLRAQEEADWRSKQLQGMSQVQNTTGNLNQQDLAAAANLGNLGAQYANMGADYYKTGGQLQQGYAQNANQAFGTGQQYNLGMTQSGNTAGGQGLDAYTALTGQSNELNKNATGLGVQGAGIEAGNLMNANASANDMYKFNAGENLQKYGIDKGVAIQQQQASDQKTAAMIGAAATVGAGLLSDIRTKKDIRPAVRIIEDLRPKHSPQAMMQRIASLAHA